jgi:hypothetical protein
MDFPLADFRFGGPISGSPHELSRADARRKASVARDLTPVQYLLRMQEEQPEHAATVAGEEERRKRRLHNSQRLSPFLQQLTTVPVATARSSGCNQSAVYTVLPLLTSY